MKLRLTLALLLGLSLACGSEEETTSSTDGTDETTETTPPPPPPPPTPEPNEKSDNSEDDGSAEDGSAEDGSTEDGSASDGENVEEIEGTEPTEEEADEEEYESKTFTVNFTTDARHEMRDTAQRRLNSASNAAGYGNVRKVKLSNVNCDDSGCSAAPQLHLAATASANGCDVFYEGCHGCCDSVLHGFNSFRQQ